MVIGTDQAITLVDLDIDAIEAAIIAEIVDSASSCGIKNVVIVKRKSF